MILLAQFNSHERLQIGQDKTIIIILLGRQKVRYLNRLWFYLPSSTATNASKRQRRFGQDKSHHHHPFRPPKSWVEQTHEKVVLCLECWLAQLDLVFVLAESVQKVFSARSAEEMDSEALCEVLPDTGAVLKIKAIRDT